VIHLTVMSAGAKSAPGNMGSAVISTSRRCTFQSEVHSNLMMWRG
jgi:hypothetical protein